MVAGDPCQLPPIIAHPAQVTPLPAAPAGPSCRGQEASLQVAVHGLARPLFVRLVALGHASVLLKRQYRCGWAPSALVT